MTDILIDISNNNGLGAEAAITAPQVLGVYAKATESTNFQDPDYPQFRAVAAKHKKPFGAYLFIHPDVDGAAQAKYFLAYAKPKPGDLEPVVDSETLHNGDWAQAAKTTMFALQALAAKGYDPLLYGSTSFLENLYAHIPQLKMYRVWQAQYASFMQRIPGAKYVIWQFTDAQVVGKGKFDGDKLLVRDVTQLLIPKPAPKPKPKPKKPAAPKPAPELVSENGKGQGTVPKK